MTANVSAKQVAKGENDVNDIVPVWRSTHLNYVSHPALTDPALASGNLMGQLDKVIENQASDH